MPPENDHNPKLIGDPDPRLDALLDAALAPDAAPERLNERIVATTKPYLSPGPRWYASLGLLRFAAVLVMAIGLGVVLWSASLPENESLPPLPPGALTASDPEQAAPTLDELATRLDRLAALSDAAAEERGWIDDQIDMVDLRFELVRTAEDWPDEQQVIDATGTRYELDRMVDDMSLMF